MAMVKVGDMSLDPNKLPAGLKIALFPIFLRYFGFFRTVALLYGGMTGDKPPKHGGHK